MPAYTINCDECSADYYIYIEQNDTHNRPEHCSYCGAELKAKNVKSDADEFEDEDWDNPQIDVWMEDDNSRY